MYSCMCELASYTNFLYWYVHVRTWRNNADFMFRVFTVRNAWLQEKEEQSLHTARRERARADTLWMKEVIVELHTLIYVAIPLVRLTVVVFHVLYNIIIWMDDPRVTDGH